MELVIAGFIVFIAAIVLVQSSGFFVRRWARRKGMQFQALHWVRTWAERGRVDDLSQLMLPGGDLAGVDLGATPEMPQGANLSHSNLRGADLRSAILRRAVLHAADLRRSRLRGADLQEADLREADLRGADLTSADLRGADLSNARVQGANFWMAAYDRRTRWPQERPPREAIRMEE
ncbi:MAG: hypothetical protein Kow0047_06400 [Anaerolineae bacterium]